MLRLTLLIALMLTPLTGFANDENESSSTCQTDPDSFWVCEGDPAWGTGYLLPPDILDLRQVRIWEAEAALVPELVEERDTFQAQRDQALDEVRLCSGEREAALAYGDSEAKRSARCEAELAVSYDVIEVALIAGGTGVAALLVGMLVGGLAL